MDLFKLFLKIFRIASRAEYAASNSNVRTAHFNGNFKIIRHSHWQFNILFVRSCSITDFSAVKKLSDHWSICKIVFAYCLQSTRIWKSGLEPEMFVEWATDPIVIKPLNLKFGHFSLMCLTTVTTSSGSIPPLFSSPEVLTWNHTFETYDWPWRFSPICYLDHNVKLINITWSTARLELVG